MAWTYDIKKLATDPVTQIRFKIGDTISSDPILEDEEIAFVYEEEGDVVRASITCCENIASKYARDPDFSLGPQNVKASDRAKAYERLAKRLARELRVESLPSAALPESEGVFSIGIMSTTTVDK